MCENLYVCVHRNEIMKKNCENKENFLGADTKKCICSFNGSLFSFLIIKMGKNLTKLYVRGCGCTMDVYDVKHRKNSAEIRSNINLINSS